MTIKRIYELAYLKQLDIWAKENDFLKAHPNDEIGQIREQRAWQELNEINRKLAELENAEETI